MMQEDQEEEEPRVAERALGQLLVSGAHEEGQRLDRQPQNRRCNRKKHSGQGISNISKFYAIACLMSIHMFNVIICGNSISDIGQVFHATGCLMSIHNSMSLFAVTQG